MGHYYRAKIQAVENKFDESMRAHREVAEVGKLLQLCTYSLQGLIPGLANILFED